MADENHPETFDDIRSGDIGIDSIFNQNRSSSVVTKDGEEASGSDSTPMINPSTTTCPQTSTTSKTPEQPQRKIQSSKKKRIGDSKSVETKIMQSFLSYS